MLTSLERERLLDIIEDASSCSDNECTCHFAANTAKDILDGTENKEVLLNGA